MPSDVRYADVSALFKRHGWWLRSIHGSHHKHSNGSKIFSVPVHHGKVKHVYYRQIKKILGEE